MCTENAKCPIKTSRRGRPDNNNRLTGNAAEAVQISACIELLSARVLEFETLRTLNDSVKGEEGNGRGVIHE